MKQPFHRSNKKLEQLWNQLNSLEGLNNQNQNSLEDLNRSNAMLWDIIQAKKIVLLTTIHRELSVPGGGQSYSRSNTGYLGFSGWSISQYFEFDYANDQTNKVYFPYYGASAQLRDFIPIPTDKLGTDIVVLPIARIAVEPENIITSLIGFEYDMQTTYPGSVTHHVIFPSFIPAVDISVVNNKYLYLSGGISASYFGGGVQFFTLKIDVYIYGLSVT